jgi:2-polyprenyl-3-methyl-5-hydroxy-6-metoxy-1,4-benzoquinol methylase
MLPDGYRVTLEHQGSHWWFRARRQLFLRQVRRAADSLVEHQQHHRPSAHGGREWQPGRLAVLDYGCAAGFDLGCLARMGLGTVEGADIVDGDDLLRLSDTPGAGAVADGGGPIHIVPRDLPALQGRFDIVTCLDVLEHLEDDVAGLRTLATLLVPGGQLIVTVPAYEWLWSGEDIISQHRRRYTRRGLLGACRAAGFEVLYASHFNLGLLPAMAAVIWWRRLTHGNWRAESNLTAASAEGGWPSAISRRLAGLVTSFEARAVGAEWVRLPAGASVVCRLRRPADGSLAEPNEGAR